MHQFKEVSRTRTTYSTETHTDTLVVVSMCVWLTGYSDYVTSLHQPLSALYSCHAGSKKVCPDIKVTVDWA